MDLGRFLAEAVVVSGASPTELALPAPSSLRVAQLTPQIQDGLLKRFGTSPSRPTIWRILKAFVGQLGLEANPGGLGALVWLGLGKAVLNLIDDHSRFSLASVAFRSVKAPDVLHTFYAAAESYGYPAKFLSDNAAVFSGAPRRGRVVLESELDRLASNVGYRSEMARSPKMPLRRS